MMKLRCTPIRKLHRHLAGLVCAAILCVCAVQAHAQNTGSIVGEVTDPTGAVIPNAQITAHSTTGLIRHAVSSASGAYVLNELPIGTYSVTVQVPGFETFSNAEVKVDVDQNVRVDAHLQPGQVSQKVTVSAAPPQVDTHSDTLSAVIPQELVNDMPSSTGQPFDFIGILPGVSDVSDRPAFAPDRNGPTFNISGSRSSDNLLLLDGLMHNNLFRNTGAELSAARFPLPGGNFDRELRRPVWA